MCTRFNVAILLSSSSSIYLLFLSCLLTVLSSYAMSSFRCAFVASILKVTYLLYLATGWNSLHSCMRRKSASVPQCCSRLSGVTSVLIRKLKRSRREPRWVWPTASIDATSYCRLLGWNKLGLRGKYSENDAIKTKIHWMDKEYG